MAPGPRPFPPATLHVVVFRGSIIHMPDKAALMAEAFRMLKAGGWFLASGWRIGTEVISAEMAARIAGEGLDFGTATQAPCRAAIPAAGFGAISAASPSGW
jgi:SAM-dependent methyltransferase